MKAVSSKQERFSSRFAVRGLLRAMIRWGLTHWGKWIETIRGPSVTITHKGRRKSAIEQLRPSQEYGDVDLILEAREVIFKTHYRRAWIPDVKRSVYEVQGSVNERYRHLFDAKLFEQVTYPLLCHPALRGTRYPHLFAMLAYLNRVYPTNHPFRRHGGKVRFTE